MPSITATLKETFFLCMQKFWYLVVIFLLTEVPSLLWSRVESIPTYLQISLGAGIDTVFVAVQGAGIFGLLKKREADPGSNWQAMSSGIKSYFWILLKVNIALTLVALITSLPVTIELTTVLGLFFFILSFTFIGLCLNKLSLALPIAVSENLSVLQVLRRSWMMTQGRLFWYVLICSSLAVLPFLLFDLVVLIVTSVLEHQNGYLLLSLITAINTPIGIILSWVMYFRILDQAPPATLTLSSSSASSKPVP